MTATNEHLLSASDSAVAAAAFADPFGGSDSDVELIKFQVLLPMLLLLPLLVVMIMMTATIKVFAA